MPLNPTPQALFPQGTYVTASSTAQGTAYDQVCGQRTMFIDQDVSAGTITKNSELMRYAILVKNGSGSAITPGMALNWVSGYWGTQVQACPAGSAIRCYAPSYVNGSTSTTIPDQAYFWAIYDGPTSPLSDGTAIAVNDLLVVGSASGKVAKYYGLGGGLIYSSTATSTAISNTVTPTLFSNSYTFPANSLLAGDAVQFRMACPITWAAGQLTFDLLLGSTVVATTGAITNATGDIFVIEGALKVNSIGASGSFTAEGFYMDGTSGGSTSSAMSGGSARAFQKAATTVDTTATQQLALRATWSTQNAGNSVTNTDFTVAKVNSVGTGVASGIAIATAASGSSVQFRAMIRCNW